MKRILVLFIFPALISIINGKGELLSVVQIFRHGHRTPVIFSKTDPHNDPKHWNGLKRGELTELGRKQQKELGAFLRKRYAEFLPVRYSKSDIVVKASHSQRTYQSARSFLEGLYPDDHHHIPLQKAGRSVLRAVMNCPKYSLHYMKLLKTDDYFVDVDRRNEEMYQYIHRHNPAPVPSLVSAYALWDCLGLESQRNLTLEEWAKPLYPFPLEYVARNVSMSVCYNEEMQRLGTGTLIDAVMTHFESHLRKPKEKVVLFSGHDVNIACLLGTFGAYQTIEPHNPPFASSIIIELRRNEDRVYLNGYYKTFEEVKPIRFKDCDFDCDFGRFKDIFKSIRLTEWEWVQECLSLM